MARGVVSGINSFGDLQPELLKEFDWENNTGIDPYSLAEHSNVKVNWKCEKGHTWSQAINTRVGNARQKGTKCPYCCNQKVWTGYNDLETIYGEVRPDVIESYLKSEKNKLKPSEILAGGNTKYYWICADCEYERPATVRTRVNHGCTACTNKIVTDKNCLATTHPDIAARWDYKANAPVTPKDVNWGGNKEYAFICESCGQTYWDTIGHQKEGRGCNECNKGRKTSKPEVFLYLTLQESLKQFTEIEHRARIADSEFDIYLPKLNTVISYENDYHHKYKERVIEKDKFKVKLAKDLKLLYFRVIENREITGISYGNHNEIYWNPKGYGLEALREISKKMVTILSVRFSLPVQYMEPVDLEKQTNEMLSKRYKTQTLAEVPWIMQWWDADKNCEIGLNPKFLPKGVHVPAYWKCPDCDDSFKLRSDAFVYRRKFCKKCKKAIEKQ